MNRALYRTFFTFALPKFFIIFFLYSGCKRTEQDTETRKVFIKKVADKYILYRNGHPFHIKGAAGYSHLSMLKATGGNTIRVWDTVDIASILDEAHAHHIAVIAGLPMPESNYTKYFYEDSLKAAQQYQGLKRIVEQYKDHPALLMWCLGNELGFYQTLHHDAFYKAFNNLIDMIHQVDPDHPVTTSLVVFQKKRIANIKLRASELDLISFNTFGRLASFRQHLNNFAWFWDGPYLITEWGINGPWEEQSTAWGAPIENTSTKKAAQYLTMYEQYMPTQDPRFLGSFVFYWGQKQERTHTWFSMFSEEGYTTEAVHTMQYVWTGTKPANHAPQIQYMLVDQKGAHDDIIFKPNTTKVAEVFLHEPDKDSVTFSWEILHEDWYEESATLHSKPKPLEGLIISSENHMLQFKTPSQEGPYRIFVKVIDNHGNVATANTPIYIVK